VVQIGDPSETDPSASRYLNERMQGGGERDRVRCLCDSRGKKVEIHAGAFFWMGWDGSIRERDSCSCCPKKREASAAFISERGSLSSGGSSARNVISAGGRFTRCFRAALLATRVSLLLENLRASARSSYWRAR